MDRYTECLFENILVPLSGDEESWQTLEQALIIAKRECSRLHGLHVVTDKSQLASPEKLAIQAQFEQRCKGEGVEGRLAIEFGEITPKICERATLVDLVVIKAVHPPGAGLSAFASPFRDIIANSPRPVLALPGKAARLERALLAYDDSPKAREALFVAAYLAETWKTTLTVFSLVENSRKPSTVQDYARRYLELHEVEAEYIQESGTMENLKKLLLKKEIDLLLLGGYSGSAIKEMTIGSTVNLMLRETSQPILICR
jgi:nucleotide-binding universal stress UspA family protein